MHTKIQINVTNLTLFRPFILVRTAVHLRAFNVEHKLLSSFPPFHGCRQTHSKFRRTWNVDWSTPWSFCLRAFLGTHLFLDLGPLMPAHAGECASSSFVCCRGSRLAARGMTCGNWRRRRVRGWLRQDEQNRRRCERMLEPSARAKDGEKQAVGRHYFDQGLVSCDVCAVARALPGRSRGRGLSPPFHWGRRSPSGAFGQPLPRWASRRSGACRREGKSGKSCLQAQTQPSFASAPVS